MGSSKNLIQYATGGASINTNMEITEIPKELHDIFKHVERSSDGDYTNANCVEDEIHISYVDFKRMEIVRFSVDKVWLLANVL